MKYFKQSFIITILVFGIFFNLTMCVYPKKNENNGYEIVFKKNISELLTDKKNAVHPTRLAMSNDGVIYFLEEYREYFRLSQVDISLIKKKEVLINNRSEDKLLSFKITPLANNELIIQGYKVNKDYKETSDNKTEPFYFTKILHLDENLEIINQMQIPRMGLILPVSSSQQGNYYMLGNFIHIIENPIKQNNYLIKLDKSGAIINEIEMHDETTDLLISMIKNDNVNIYNENELIIISNRDLFNKNSFNASSPELWPKLKNNISIYLLMPEQKTMEKKYDLTVEILDSYKRLNIKENHENLLDVGDFHYNRNNKDIFFTIYQLSDYSTCGRILNIFLVKFNIETHKFNMVKLGNEFDRPIFIGYHGDICYLFNWETSELYGLKF